MSYVHVRDASEAESLARALAASRSFALDCEAAGFHRYSDRLCLLQVTAGATTWVLDPLAFDPTPLLKGPLEDPSVEIVMHGADYDLRLLHRDLGIRLRGLFDTQVAASLLGVDGLGLQALLEARLGIRLSKKYQKADWAERPLSDDMLDYAADDTRHLARLAESLKADLRSAGRTGWVDEECRALEASAVAPAPEAEPEDPVTRVKGARDLSPRQVTALRQALEWRDQLARERDKAPFRIVGDPPLVEAVLTMPADVRELSGIKGFPERIARTDGATLVERLQAAAALPDAELRPYPRAARRGPGRPPPEVEELAERLKVARNRRAEELGLDRGTLVSNAVLQAVALSRPRDMAALRAVEGLHAWQADAVGEPLLEVLRRAP